LDGNVNEAIKYFTAVIARRTDVIAAEAQYLIGWSYLNKEEYALAAEELLKVRYLYQRHDFWVNSATLDAAVCQENLDKKDEAIRLYNLVLDNNSDNQFAEEASAGLERLR